MRESSFRHLFNLVVVVILAAAVIMAMGYNRQARLMPLLIGIPILILAIVHTMLEFRDHIPAEKEVKISEKPYSPDGRGTERSEFAKEVAISLWILGLFVSIYLFGHLITTLFYTFLALKIRARFSWKISLGVAIGSWAFIYFMLVKLLQASLYDGVVVMAMRKAFWGY